MKKLLIIPVFFSFVLISVNSEARNDRLKFSVADALNTTDAHSKLDKDIKFVFGTKNKQKVKTSFGTFTSNKKTRAFGKSDKLACERAFLSAMISFQKRARQMGGNAVINIKSNYYKKMVDSSEIFECGAGAMVAGVTFIGEVVTLKK